MNVTLGNGHAYTLNQLFRLTRPTWSRHTVLDSLTVTLPTARGPVPAKLVFARDPRGDQKNGSGSSALNEIGGCPTKGTAPFGWRYLSGYDTEKKIILLGVILGGRSASEGYG